MKNFAKIGKAVLKRILSIQVHQQFSHVSSSATIFSCGKYPLSSCENNENIKLLTAAGRVDQANNLQLKCQSCPYYISHTETNYKFEYKTDSDLLPYGNTARLKVNAIRLFFYLHFQDIDGQGIIRYFDIKHAAKTIGCDQKTIKANLNTLVYYGYIAVSNMDNKESTAQILLKDYKKYFVKRNEGGHGYMTLSQKDLVSILSTKQVLPMRLRLATILENDSGSIQKIFKKQSQKKQPGNLKISFKKLKQYLPGYCRKNIIIKNLDKLSDQVSYREVDKENLEIDLKTYINVKDLKEKMLSDAESQIRTHLTQNFDDPSINMNTNTITDIDLDPPPTELIPFNLTYSDYTDLAHIAVQYTVVHVLEILDFIYYNYVLKKIPIKSIGALVRQSIKRHLQYNF